jgi:hypothetical protein
MEAKGVVVTWPSGLQQSLGNLMAGARVTARERVDASVDAGPDGTANTSSAAVLVGRVEGASLQGATYAWTFHGPSVMQTIEGIEAHFTPPSPGIYTAELKVTDRFGAPFGSDFCIMTVSDTSAPSVVVQMPATITAAGRPVFDASNTTDNDPSFRAGGTYEWVFRNGALEVKATGQKPQVQLPKPGVWNVSLTVTDPSGNKVMQSFDARVSGVAPSPLTTEMVLLALFLPLGTIAAIALLQPRIWRREGEGLTPDHFAELRAHDIVVATVGAPDALPFPFRPDHAPEEE